MNATKNDEEIINKIFSISRITDLISQMEQISKRLNFRFRVRHYKRYNDTKTKCDDVYDITLANRKGNIPIYNIQSVKRPEFLIIIRDVYTQLYLQNKEENIRRISPGIGNCTPGTSNDYFEILRKKKV